MTLTESPPHTPPNRQPNVVVSPDEHRANRRFVLALVLGGLAVGTLGLVALLLGSLALADSGTTPVAPAVVDVSLSEFAIKGQLTVPAGEVILSVSNKGSMAHNLVVPGVDGRTPDFGPGQTRTLNLGTLEPGTYEMFCDLPGHKESGMVTELVVVGEGTEIVDQGGDEPDFQALDNAMMESMLAFPAETEGRGNPILAPTEVLADGTKVFDLTTSIVDWEVEPGKLVKAWTYNGVVPGPRIQLDRDDHVQIRIDNQLPMGTDVHWHGVHTPNDQDGVAPYTQDLIEPGEKFTYEFTVDDDAIGMYHAHNHSQMQVVNGLFGAITIGENPIPYGQTFSGVTIPEDLVLAVDEPMVLNDAGTIGLSLNGKSFPATEPLVLKQGDWVSITYYNEGLQIHPMHLHQFPQLVYAKDGIPLDHAYWVDTLNVAPGERYTVLFRVDDPGTWVWHCHILTHVEREDGMFGMVTAIVVQEDPTFDPTEHPVNPTNWRNTAGGDGDHDHGA